jgi:hypothetical protein
MESTLTAQTEQADPVMGTDSEFVDLDGGVRQLRARN